MAHLGQELRLGGARALGLGRGVAQLVRGREVPPHLRLQLHARGEDLGVVERHHGAIAGCTQGGDHAQALQGQQGHVVHRLGPDGVDDREDGEADRELSQEQQAQTPGRPQIHEGQQRDVEHPRQHRRGDAAVEVTAPQDAEDQVLDGDERQQIIATHPAEQGREDPEGQDGRGQDRGGVAGRRIEEQQGARHHAADERAAKVADQEHARALALFALGGDRGRDEPVHQAVQPGEHPRR